eukprot:comp18305_c0_seq1/m.19355 comp18305_c0_seq1/g.19355  ORF comp18305_c0_seq1/g.19355 comp18305_c0_seq1/m.19355 type:complete len:298 (-) comp18305_c0_seq1:50-943(-)
MAYRGTMDNISTGPSHTTPSVPANEPGVLVIVRHGLSVFNRDNRFTGWLNPPLCEDGLTAAKEAGISLKEIHFDAAYASVLERAKITMDLVLEGAGQKDVERYYDMALNERDYGELNGLDKHEAIDKYGKEMVEIWRRSYAGCPPGGESLKMTAQRCIPYVAKEILPRVFEGQNVFVSAHGNSIRAILMLLLQYSSNDILKTEIGWCEPVVVRFNGEGAIIDLACVPRPGTQSSSHFPYPASSIETLYDVPSCTVYQPLQRMDLAHVGEDGFKDRATLLSRRTTLVNDLLKGGFLEI